MSRDLNLIMPSSNVLFEEFVSRSLEVSPFTNGGKMGALKGFNQFEMCSDI